jgi:hypothetical protein
VRNLLRGAHSIIALCPCQQRSSQLVPMLCRYLSSCLATAVQRSSAHTSSQQQAYDRGRVAVLCCHVQAGAASALQPFVHIEACAQQQLQHFSRVARPQRRTPAPAATTSSSSSSAAPRSTALQQQLHYLCVPTQGSAVQSLPLLVVSVREWRASVQQALCCSAVPTKTG